MQSDLERFPPGPRGARLIQTGIDNTRPAAGSDFGMVPRDRRIARRQPEARA